MSSELIPQHPNSNISEPAFDIAELKAEIDMCNLGGSFDGINLIKEPSIESAKVFPLVTAQPITLTQFKKMFFSKGTVSVCNIFGPAHPLRCCDFTLFPKSKSAWLIEASNNKYSNEYTYNYSRLGGPQVAFNYQIKDVLAYKHDTVLDNLIPEGDEYGQIATPHISGYFKAQETILNYIELNYTQFDTWEISY